jgi:DNA-binding NtrC family response regulator
VLETREVVRLGANKPVQVDVRIVAATNRDLEAEVRSGRFREDLYDRLKVVTIEMPPLRDRASDVPLLATQFVQEFSERYGKQIAPIPPSVMRRFEAYAWPGNVRELRNVIENMVLLAKGPKFEHAALPSQIASLPGGNGSNGGSVADGGAAATPSPELPLADVERDHIVRVLQHVGGNRKKAAQVLKIGERTLYRKIKEYEESGHLSASTET